MSVRRIVSAVVDLSDLEPVEVTARSVALSVGPERVKLILTDDELDHLRELVRAKAEESE